MSEPAYTHEDVERLVAAAKAVEAFTNAEFMGMVQPIHIPEAEGLRRAAARIEARDAADLEFHNALAKFQNQGADK